MAKAPPQVDEPHDALEPLEASDDGPDESVSAVTDPCPECGERVQIPGKLGPAAALGIHRRHEHGVSGSRNKRKKGPVEDLSREAAPGEIPPQRPEPKQRVRVGPGTAGDTVGDGAGKKGAPSAADLSKTFGKLASIGSSLAAGMMVEGDPRIPLSDNPDRTEERMVDALTLNEREAMILVRPLGVLMAGTKINAKVGRKIVDAAPLLDSAAVAAAYIREIRAYRRDRRLWDIQYVEASARPAPARHYNPVDQTMHAGKTSAPPGGVPMEEGRLMTPEDVARLRAERNGDL
jgi:hypothetical protein